MENTKIKISSIVESQLPLFVREDYPFVTELLVEYYRSLEEKGSSYDILQNIDNYVKINNLTNIIETTTLTSDVDFSNNSINVVSTNGFPDLYGLIYINNEIILYKSKTETSFDNCFRGFSGITEYSSNNSEDFTFSNTEAEQHVTGDTATNLSSLFLKEFFNKSKKQFLHGFEDRQLFKDLNKNLFLKQSKDFYTSKGTDRSFEILFRVLYGKDVEVILPENNLIKPSNAQYRITRNFVVEPIQGDVENLLNKTIFQDEYGSTPKAYATVTDVQKTVRDGKTYYVLMLDYDFDKDIIVSGTFFGSLNIHPKTKIISEVPAFSSNIVVDSTIGFPDSGEVVVNFGTGDIIIEYNDKTINQFLNCTGITQSIPAGTDLSENNYAYGYSDDEEIRFRISGVISDINIPDDNFYYEKGDIAKILSLGYNQNRIKDNNWIFNTKVLCDVKNFIDDGNFKYTIETFDRNGVYEGDSVTIDYINSDTGIRSFLEIDGSNVKIPSGSIPGKIFQIQTNGIRISNIFNVKRNISKFSDNFVSDVLNVYRNFDTDDVYVASSSLPFYGSDTNSSIEDYKIFLNGTFSGETLKVVSDGEYHGYITGDAVVYSSENSNIGSGKFNIQDGIYYVKKINDTDIKLARSRSDINARKFLSIGATSVTNNTLSLLKFTKENNLPSDIDSQRIVRVISEPSNDGKKYDTLSGTTGILINGVEILNYKSEDYIYYGPIKSIDVISPGKGFDILNPPILEISSGEDKNRPAKGFCGVEGSLERVDIIDSGFDYIDTPVISITGGNGSGASAIPKMIDYDHYVDLNPTSSNGRINLIQNEIGFSTYHKFRDGESIVYNDGNGTPIGGLVNQSVYYANVVDDYKIKLHKNEFESLVGINTVDITSFGKGNHRFESTIRKKKINSIIVTNSGSGYKNKKIEVSSSGINTANNTINVYKHPYLSGDIIYYYGGETNISGLTTGKYIVTKIDNSSFKVSNIGLGNTSLKFYYNTKQYINFTSSGVGTHTFNYEPIQVNITGKVGISTISNVDVTAKVQPIFRGSLNSIFVSDGGIGYGSSTILNYNLQPNFNFNSGSNAKITPVISSGKIVDVIINEKGSNYNSPPDLYVKGSGVGAVLTPILKNGRLDSVNIVNSGVNYEQKNTTIEVITPLTGYEVKSYPKKWTINKFNRLFFNNKISSDDSTVYSGLNKNYGIQYTHLYSPRPLRKKISSKELDGNDFKYKQDYQNDFDNEKYHSPLIGWAYDGNPIYGPYGYDSPTNKEVRQIISGYSDPIDNLENRPNKKEFPAGYFVEDYAFDGSGDLDEHNGRFCVTPEYPNGTYAYFMTLDSQISFSGPFSGDKKPKFPYIIGNTFKSKPVNFNFRIDSNQEKFDFNNENIIRNTYPYNTISDNSYYEYFIKKDFLKSQNAKVTSTSKGQIESIKIISGGENYKVNDRLVFNNKNSGGTGASSKINYIKGKSIVGISQTSTTISDVEFYPSSIPNRILGFTSNPHNLLNNNLIYINSLSDYDLILQNQFNVGVRSDRFILNLGVNDASSTGIVTYFYISGSLDFPSIRENDILSLNNEDVKVLNIDKKTSRIRVLREQNSTVSSAHSAYSILYEKSRKFTISLDNNAKNKNYSINRILYFNPKESLGIGSFVGFGHTVSFSNPGVGITQIIIPEKSIYIPNHNLETGNELIYKVNNGNPFTVSSDGISTFKLQNNSIVYVAKITNDLIGISTIKVGLGSTGSFVGVYQQGSTLFFNDAGTGIYHSFETNFDDVLTGSVTKNVITVSTGSTHNLKSGDSVVMEAFPGVTTSIVVKYSDYHRRTIINPKYFSSVDIVNNLILVPNHGYSNGEKLIHTSTSPCLGLEDQGIYYASIYDENRIRLFKSYYGSINQDQDIVNIQSASFGTLSQINPKVSILRNNNVYFDLSDSSLSQRSSGVGRTSSFDFKIFLDENFNSEYLPINIDGTSKIIKTGNIGIDTEASIQFKIDDEFPNFLYYKLIPKTDLNVKSSIIVDNEIFENNKINFTLSKLNGNKEIVGVTSTTFDFFNNYASESISYSNADGDFKYHTDSLNESGEIKSIQMLSGGRSYEKLPSISSITSYNGSGAIVIPQSKSIGKITKSKLIDIGFNYPIDKTLKPLVKLPTILRIEPLSTVDYIKVLSSGINYNTAPELVVIDGFTKKVVDDIFLEYELGDDFVTVLKNSKGFYNTTPKIVPIKNSNGIPIKNISYDVNTKYVNVIFSTQFSDPSSFPFEVGDNIFIEGISITNSGSTIKGFNSKNYDYSTFPVVGINTNLGGSGSGLIYSLENYLDGSETPGIFDAVNSSGRIVSESQFPIFEVKLNKNSFILGETITSESLSGKVLKWDSINEYLTIETTDSFLANSLITGESSKSQAFIKEIKEVETFYNIDSSSVVSDGWNRNTGFLNDNLQRLQDSDYYQYFSYSLKSEVSFSDWNDVVSNLNHTLGFKKFSDLVLNSTPDISSGISTVQDGGFVSAIADLNSVVNVDCVYDFDLVSENNFYIQGELSSDEIIFNSAILQDYSESTGNRVLLIDDISQDFNTSVTRTFVTSFNI